MNRPAGTLLMLILASLLSADSEPQWMTLNHAAREAQKAKDYAKLRESLIALGPLLPGNWRILYNLATAEAHLGHQDAALENLGSLARAGLVFDIQADDELATLRGTPRFQALVRQFAQNRNAVGHAAAVSKLAETDLLPEDIAFDPKTRRFLIASVTQCKIVTGEGKLFAKTDWPVMALRVDARRRILWAATGFIPQCARCDAADKDKSALIAFQLDNGAVLKRIDCPVKGLLGDMTLSRAGDLYASEGYNGAVFRLRADAANLERLDTPGEFRSPQTPALSADERTLYVPDYLRGIAAVDLKSRAVRWLQPSPGIVLSGIDGFYQYRNSFLAVQNGVTPERVVLFSKDLKTQRILESGTPGLGEPSHGTLVGDTFYFLANTGWDAYEDDGKHKAGVAPVESEIRKLELHR